MSIELALDIARGAFSLQANITLPSRGVVALFGPSGCGKTSLLRAIAGLDKHPQGRVVVNGDVWQEDSVFVPVYQRGLAYVFQQASLFAHLDVEQNLLFAAQRVPTGQTRISLSEVITLMGLARLLSRSVTDLSGGEQQRVSIARALCSSPRLLLMDEPLSALDREAKREFYPYLDTLHREFNVPVVYVSHSLDEVARLADYLVLMDSSGIVALGDIQDMLTRLDLSLSRDPDAEAIVEAEVEQHDQQFELTYLRSKLGRFSVPRQNLAVGDQVRLRIAARDVSITLAAQSGTSILNIFAARIEEIVDLGAAQVTLRLDAGGVPILARVTRKSASTLGLSIGKVVYAQAKSVALL